MAQCTGVPATHTGNLDPAQPRVEREAADGASSASQINTIYKMYHFPVISVSSCQAASLTFCHL